LPQVLEQIRVTAPLLAPEIILLATVCVLFLVGPLLVTHAGEAPAGMRHRCGFLSLAAIGVAWMLWYYGGPSESPGALFRIDELAWFVRGLSLSVGVLLVLVLWNQIDDARAAEAHACLLTILVGASLVASASDLVSLFLALELVSIPTYVILYLPRHIPSGGEGALKYFLLSIFSSALVLYGMSWLYGVTGSTNFAAITDMLAHRPPHAGEGLLAIAFALVLAGLCFRIAAVPFHFYAPDVFQGATASNAALLSFIPKVVGFAALLRLIKLSGATDNPAQWLPDHPTKMLLALLAVLTMFVGNLMALRQKNLYRLMAYSSVAHAGYMLIGLMVGDARPVDGTNALLFYLAVYGFMTIGVFAIIGGMTDGQRRLETDTDLRGLSRTQPAAALLLAICLFSLTGLPPTAGFLGKLNLFLAAWSEGSRLAHNLAFVLGANAAIGAWYYLRLIGLMFLDAPVEPEFRVEKIGWSSWLAGIACTTLTIVIFVAPQWLWNSIP
jgi:NADH-quinone oxidoreductase subunit N